MKERLHRYYVYEFKNYKDITVITFNDLRAFLNIIVSLDHLTYSINFSSYITYRCIQINNHKIDMQGLYTIEDSEYVKWYLDTSQDPNEVKDFSHYALFTKNYRIDVIVYAPLHYIPCFFRV